MVGAHFSYAWFQKRQLLLKPALAAKLQWVFPDHETNLMTCCLGPDVQKEAAVKLGELIYMKISWG